MIGNSSPQYFSTVARGELIVAGRSYELAQIAATFVILQTPADIPAGDAELVITVVRVEGDVPDGIAVGDETWRQIRLPDGATQSSDWVRIERK